MNLSTADTSRISDPCLSTINPQGPDRQHVAAIQLSSRTGVPECWFVGRVKVAICPSWWEWGGRAYRQLVLTSPSHNISCACAAVLLRRTWNAFGWYGVLQNCTSWFMDRTEYLGQTENARRLLEQMARIEVDHWCPRPESCQSTLRQCAPV